MPVKIVMFWQTLLRGRCSQKFDVFSWTVLTEGQLVDFLFAGKNVTVALEQTFLDIVVYWQANRLHLHSMLIYFLRFRVVASLKFSGLVVAKSGIFMVDGSSFLAVLICLNLLTALAPTQKGINNALYYGVCTSFDFVSKVFSSLIDLL